MNIKGFTLIELLAVTVILAILLVLTVPNLVSVYNRSQQRTYDEFIERIEMGAKVYAELYNDNIPGLEEIGGFGFITIRDLVDKKILRTPIIDPSSGEEVDLNEYIKITRTGSNIFEIELFVEYEPI